MLFLYDAQRGELMVPPDWAGGQLLAAAWDGADPRLVAAVSSTSEGGDAGAAGRTGGTPAHTSRTSASRRTPRMHASHAFLLHPPARPTQPTTAGSVHLYRHIPASVAGPGLKLVATQAAPAAGAALLALHAGVLAWHMPDGGLHPQLLDSHRHLAETPPRGAQPASRTGSSKWRVQLAAAATSGLSREERLAARCRQALELCHFERALGAARQLGDAALLREVAAAALQLLELPVAVAAYEAAGDEASLAQLRPLLGKGDEDLVAGQLVALTGGALRWAVGSDWHLGRVQIVHAGIALWHVGTSAACTRTPAARPPSAAQATPAAQSSCCWPARAPRRPSRCGGGWATGSARWSWRSTWSLTRWVGWRCCARRRWRRRARCGEWGEAVGELLTAALAWEHSSWARVSLGGRLVLFFPLVNLQRPTFSTLPPCRWRRPWAHMTRPCQPQT